MKPAAAPADQAAIERFRRVLLFNIGALVVLEAGLALGTVWLGFSWFVVALMAFVAFTVAYLVYLVRRFTTPRSPTIAPSSRNSPRRS